MSMKFKELFFGYYPPSEEELSEWWKTGLFVFDANALLDFYSLGDTTRTELFTFLDSVKGRVWVPHRAGFEFQRNRIKVIEQQVSKYKQALGRLERLLPDMKKSAEEAQKGLDAPEAVKVVAEQVATKFEDLFSKIAVGTDSIAESVKHLTQELEAVRDRQQALIIDDPILMRVTRLLGDNVGDEYDEKRLKEICAEGAVRYGHVPKVPPGYEDINKEGDDKYGDLLVWYQTIDKAKEANLPVLMVSQERKADWVECWGGTTRARKELVQEMYREAEAPFYLYTLTQLMEGAKKYLGASFSSTSISDATRVEQDEVKNVQEEQDETIDAQKTYKNRTKGRQIAFRISPEFRQQIQGQKSPKKINAGINLAKWLASQYLFAAINHNPTSFPDVSIQLPSGRFIGVEVRFVNESQPLGAVASDIMSVFRQGERLKNRNEFSDIIVCLICHSQRFAEQVVPTMMQWEDLIEDDKIWTGTLNNDGSFSPAVISDIARS